MDGKLYELDGLKEGPILIGDCDMESWMETAMPVIAERIRQYSQMEIRFNLMGVIRNRSEVLAEEKKSLEKERERAIGLVQSRGVALPLQEELEDMLEKARAAAGFQLPEIVQGAEANVSPEDLFLILAAVNESIQKNEEEQKLQEDKFAQWKIENCRRKHDYLPFVVRVLQHLAEKNELMPLVEKASKKSKT